MKLDRLFCGALLSTSVSLAGCADARCDPNPVGAPWKKYESLLPDKAVVCGPNRVSAKKPSDVKDDYPPSHLFVFYEDKNPAGAFLATTDKLSAAGWKVTPESPVGEGQHAIYGGKATKGGATISMSINRNDWGTQGSFELTEVKDME